MRCFHRCENVCGCFAQKNWSSLNIYLDRVIDKFILFVDKFLPFRWKFQKQIRIIRWHLLSKISSSKYYSSSACLKRDKNRAVRISVWESKQSHWPFTTTTAGNESEIRNSFAHTDSGTEIFSLRSHVFALLMKSWRPFLLLSIEGSKKVFAVWLWRCKASFHLSCLAGLS